jgi:glycine cleavage system H lipoate-binding protein
VARIEKASDPDRFHDTQHLWLRVLPAGCVQIGLDPLAARLLGPGASLEMMPAGTRLSRGETAATMSVAGEPVRFASPLTGEVLRVHRVRPGRIPSMLVHPYSRAWLFILSVPRLGKRLSSFLFGRNAGLCLAREWAAVQEECLGLAARTAGMPGSLPDGGELDLVRLSGSAGPAYPQLVRRWIGMERIHGGWLGTRASAGERAIEGGAKSSPEGR